MRTAIVSCIVCDAVKSSRISAKKECKLVKRKGSEVEIIDREKVVNDLSTALVQMHGPGRYTPEDVDELEEAGWQALKFLESEEGYKVIYTQCDGSIETICGCCGYGLDKKYGICPKCGRPVKWND